MDFYLHTSAPLQTMVTSDELEAQTNQVLVNQDVLAYTMAVGKDWTRITLNITVLNSDSRLDFRTYWQGTVNMDVACVV